MQNQLDSLFYVFKKNFMDGWIPLWMGISCLKTTEPLRGDSLLFTIPLPGVSGTQLIDLGRMKD